MRLRSFRSGWCARGSDVDVDESGIAGAAIGTVGDRLKRVQADAFRQPVHIDGEDGHGFAVIPRDAASADAFNAG